MEKNKLGRQLKAPGGKLRQETGVSLGLIREAAAFAVGDDHR